MKKRIIIVYGWDGSSQGDWMPWTTQALEKFGYDVACLDMPHPERPTIDDWVSYLTEKVGEVDESTFFIGHSIGCQAIMRFIEKVDVKAGGVFFVSPWFDLENLEGPESEEIAKPWIEGVIDLEKVKSKLGFVTIFLGDNDEWVPYEKTKDKFESLLGAEVITLHGAGHITGDDGYIEFPELVSLVHDKLLNV